MKYFILLLVLFLILLFSFIIDKQSVIEQKHNIILQSKKIYAIGIVEGETKNINLKSKIMGCIKNIYFHENDYVKQGQILLQLNDINYKQEYTLCLSNLHLAKIRLQKLLNGNHFEQINEVESLYNAKLLELEQAQNYYQRINKLTKGSIAQQTLDNQKNLVDILQYQSKAFGSKLNFLKTSVRDDDINIEKANIKIAEDNLLLAEYRLKDTQIIAPCDGKILINNVQVGEIIGPTSIEPSIIMVNTNKIRIRAFIEELDALLVNLDMKAEIILDDNITKFTGKIININSNMNFKQIYNNTPMERYDTKVREILIDLDNKNNMLIIGLRVNVIINI